ERHPPAAREHGDAGRPHEARRDPQGAGRFEDDLVQGPRHEQGPAALLGAVKTEKTAVPARAKLLTIVEVAERLRISKRAAYRIARQMIHVEIGGRLLVPEPAVDRYIETHTKEPTAWDVSTSAAEPTTRTSSTSGGAASSAPSA